MRAGVTCALLACALVAAQPACGRSIDLRQAGDAAGAAASALGEVERVDCSRAPGAVHTRLRHAAICVVRLRTVSGAACVVFYDLRVAGKRGRAVKVTRAWPPWCAGPHPRVQAASLATRAVALVRAHALRYGDVARIACKRARRADGRVRRGRVLCAVWMRVAPGCALTYEVRREPSGPAVFSTYVPWCAPPPQWA